jgi:hypothetical protein
LPGLVLAGSWTDTGWPDTMEGAVRSGLNAVIALHDALARGASAAANGAVNRSPAAATSPGTNPETSGLEGVREPATEVTEVNSEVKIKADEREVRS